MKERHARAQPAISTAILLGVRWSRRRSRRSYRERRQRADHSLLVTDKPSRHDGSVDEKIALHVLLIFQSCGRLRVVRVKWSATLARSEATLSLLPSTRSVNKLIRWFFMFRSFVNNFLHVSSVKSLSFRVSHIRAILRASYFPRVCLQNVLAFLEHKIANTLPEARIPPSAKKYIYIVYMYIGRDGSGARRHRDICIFEGRKRRARPSSRANSSNIYLTKRPLNIPS